MPGANERALEKARTLPADSLILDLEDAVAPDAKRDARAQAVAAVKDGGYGEREVVIRVNGLNTPWGYADLAAVAGAGADAILLPKTENVESVRQAETVLAARAGGLDLLDGVYNDFRDEDGFGRECAEAAAMGFDGKTLIHPAQIGPANAVFLPSEAEIAEAEEIAAAFAKPENAGKGAISIHGRMVERLHLEQAGRVLARAAAMKERGR
jgi:citrate lyase beta subunit